MARKPVHHVSDPVVWKVLFAPVRAEIIETMRMLAPCGIADVARHLDRPADSLYRHFEKLVATGIVFEAGTRSTGRRSERLYDLIADDVGARFKLSGSPAANDAYLATVRSILTMSARTFRGAAAAGQLVGLGLDKPCTMRAFFEHVWLSEADFAELNGLLVALKRFLDSKKTRTPDTRLQLVSVLTSPIVRRRGAARTAPGPRSLPTGPRHTSSATRPTKPRKPKP